MSDRIHEIHGIAGVERTDVHSDGNAHVTVEDRLGYVVLAIGQPGERRAVRLTLTEATIISSHLVSAASRAEDQGGEGA